MEGNTIACDRRFSDIDSMEQHAAECKYRVSNRKNMFACPNKGCNRLFTNIASVNPHVNHHCEFTTKKIRTLSGKYCGDTFS